ncbi:YkvS family protein [Bacillus sp. 'calajunan']|uniref:YkvS family protein n=1 Tax=Bacillus sp. 'calajunan' TaxID=3447457 RepID=UPI003EE1DE87
MQIEENGDFIELKGSMQGRVQKVNQNSVIVDITIMENLRELDMEPLTVVSHKNYTVINQNA